MSTQEVQKISDYFSIERSQMLKGVLAIGIVLLHSDGGRMVTGLGAPLVSVFYFIAGYGLLSSYILKKEKYLGNFLRKRLSKVIIPFIISIFLYQVLLHIDGRGIGIIQMLNRCLTGHSPECLLPYSWFVFAIIYFYICFYIVYRYIKNNVEYGLFYLLFSTILYICVTRFLLGWGSYWYVSAFAFNAGLIWKYKENAILTFLQKGRYALLMIILIPLVIVLFGRREPAAMPLYPIFVLIAFSLISIPRIKLFSYLGVISYEIYLLQGIPIKLLRENHINIQNDYVFILLNLIITIILAMIVHRGITSFQNLFHRKNIAFQ